MDIQLQNLINSLENSNDRYQVANQIAELIKAQPSEIKKNLIIEIKSNRNIKS